LAGLPPLRIDVGEDEILRNDAAWFARNAESAGVPVDLVIWSEMWHGWYLYAPYLPDAIEVHQAIGEFIRDHI
jgi:acetyl esterase/lipase